MPDAVWLSGSALGSGYRDCGTCGAVVPYSKLYQHENFHLTFSNLRGENVSRVAWCDYGDHPFKAGEDGSAKFQGTEFVEGIARQTDMDACGEHNPMNVGRQAAKYELDSRTYRELKTVEE